MVWRVADKTHVSCSWNLANNTTNGQTAAFPQQTASHKCYQEVANFLVACCDLSAGPDLAGGGPEAQLTWGQ